MGCDVRILSEGAKGAIPAIWKVDANRYSPRLDYRILNDTIVSWNDIVYREGETEESYLLRIGLGPECQYPINTAAILDAEGMKSIFDTDMEGYEKDEKVRQAWARRVSDFIAKQPEDMLLLSIDCHM